ncbi:hypothetical protein [Portibacter marinus]|uniref:hypothetical protein n=1 Tax=Portibacter marinus TaxID=2898660 RepID=UPI001F45C25D|nr:hypothetical protein [Portibacter marinus]
MKLSKWQILHLKRFLRHHYVKYEDVQLELIDHLASAIEEKMEEDQSVSFEQALNQVYKNFGTLGFSQIVKEKEKAMQKFWRKHIWKNVLDTLRPPALLATILIFILFFGSQTYLGFTYLRPVTISFCITLFAIIMCYNYYVREVQMETYLFLKSYHTYAGIIFVIFFLSLPNAIFAIGEQKELVATPLTVSLTSAYFTICIFLLYVFYFKIPSGLLHDLKSQYPQLSTNI